MRTPISALLLGSLATLAAAAETLLPTTDLTLSIPPSQHLPNPNALAAATRATLTTLGAAHAAPLGTSNAFVFRNVTPGSYLADVHCASHGFAPLRVDVDVVPATAAAGQDGGGTLRVRVWETYRGNDWENKGEEIRRMSGAGVGGGRAGGAFPVKVLGPKTYYTERGSFSVLGILKNPMILMGLVSMVLFLGLPKLVDNMDPEMRAEWEEQQKKNPMGGLMGGGAQPGANPMGNFDMAGFLAGQKKDEGSGGESSKKGGKR